MGQYNLRALSVTEILDRALRIYRAHFFVLLGITALMLIPEGILQFIGTYFWGNVQNLGNFLSVIFQNLASLALIVAVSNANLGRDFTIGSAYSKGTKKFWSLIGSNILIGMAIVLPAIVVGLCLAFIYPLGIIAILIFMPVVVFLFTRWSLNSSAIVLEALGARDGLYRSWELTKDFFWRVLGTSFLASLFALLITLLPAFFVGVAGDMLGISEQALTLTGVVVEQLGLVLVLPFTVAVKVLIYYDLRIRKEGFDLMLRAQEMPKLEGEDNSSFPTQP
jgi:hypothetical protein